MSRPGSGMRRGLPATAGVAAPADRRFRRSDFHPDRRRAGRVVVRVLARTFAVFAVAALVGWGVRFLLQSRVLAVQSLVIEGNTRLSRAEVEGLVADVRGTNILRVDFDDVRRRVMDSPWVADVTLWRRLPSTLGVRIIERTPMAVARLDQQLYLVDDRGVIIDDYSARYREFDLPIVDGLVTASGSSGALVPPGRARLAALTLAAINRRADLRRRLSQLDVSNPRDAVVMFDDDAVWLHLGDERFVERIGRYLELAPTLRERFQTLDYVDLRYDERVFARPRAEGLRASR